MKNVFLSPNLRKEGITTALEETCKVLTSCGANIIMPLKAQTIGVNGQNISYTDDDNAIKKVDFIVALGGDGTIFRIAKKAAIYNIPLIGVNVGHVGFDRVSAFYNAVFNSCIVPDIYIVEHNGIFDDTVVAYINLLK